MSDYQDQKAVIYAKLQEVDALYAPATVEVAQEEPEMVVDIDTNPLITFNVENDVPNYTVDGNISHQDVTAKVDVWGRKSTITGSIVKLVIEQMLELGYRCVYNQPLVDPSGISHVTMQFNGIGYISA